MALTPSTMVPLGTKAPDFSLPNVVTGETINFSNTRGPKGTLVVFMCNHCPYVKHILDHFVAKAGEYAAKGIGVVGISSNDVSSHPDDSPENMKALAIDKNFGFPYLYDKTQETAKSYNAACTPDFFLYDKNDELVYRGQYDSSRPGNDIGLTAEDLSAAVDVLIDGKAPLETQKPSMGCNIKWKA